MNPIFLSETERLLNNQKNLLETIPEKILLLNANGSVEYMNPSACHFFKKKSGSPEKQTLKNKLRAILEPKEFGSDCVLPEKVELDNQSYECHVAPFTGYSGDNLFWLMLKSQKGEHPGTALHSRSKILNNDNIFIGSSKIVEDLTSLVSRVATTKTTVLVEGESGTGKELIAKLIHFRSTRSTRPFLTINCNCINEQLLESELFGYEKGAFTGAGKKTKGKFEVVDGGTIFLDEIGDISPRMQAALLRVLQFGEVQRVGAATPIQVDIRIIAATNRNLATEVKKGNFRLDLFYRLSTFNIKVPPLRERKEDLKELTDFFLVKYSRIFKKPVPVIEKKARKRLVKYDWPGNVRELENVLQRAMLISHGNIITGNDITLDEPLLADNQNATLSSLLDDPIGTPLKHIVAQVEQVVIQNTLEKHHGNVALSAKVLDLSRAALYEKIKRYHINAKILR